MSESARRLATWADLLAMPDDGCLYGDSPRIPPFDAIELDDGGLFTPLA